MPETLTDTQPLTAFRDNPGEGANTGARYWSEPLE